MLRPKGQCKFNLAWLTLNKYKDWVDRDSSGDMHLAYCKVCVKTIKIGAPGKHNLFFYLLIFINFMLANFKMCPKCYRK